LYEACRKYVIIACQPLHGNDRGRARLNPPITFLKDHIMYILKSIALMLLSVMVCFCGLGCGGASRSLSGEQLAALQQIQKQKPDPNAQLLVQANQATLSGYKDYKVGPEDLLEVNFFGQDDLNRDVRVSGQGDISLPLIGGVAVAGLSPQEIERRLVQAYKDGDFIRNPQLSVSVKEFRHQRVMVTGAVANPGSYEVIGPRTLLEMLGKAGGVVDRSDMRAGDLVYVARAQNAPALMKPAKGTKAQPSGPQSIVIDLRRLLSGSAMELNIPIKNGDVIYVPPAQMAFVLGSVKKPGQVAVRDNLTVSQAVALSEGQDLVLSSNNITILRFGENGERLAIPVNLKSIISGQEPDPKLKANDVVIVQESGLRRALYDFRNFFPGGFGLSAAAF
jgi:polysaccharide biosynthesis/export protein